MTAVATPRRDGALLLSWLRLLGWRIETGHEGTEWRGIARRFDAYGREHVIDRRADSYGELASALYYEALSGLALQAAA